MHQIHIYHYEVPTTLCVYFGTSLACNCNVCKHPLSNKTKYNVKQHFYSNCQILWLGTDQSTSRWESVFPRQLVLFF
jgi:hypothetical protein